MAEAIAIVAGVTTIVNNVWKTSKDVYDLIDSIRNAPKHILAISQDVQGLYMVLGSLQGLLRDLAGHNLPVTLIPIFESLQQPLNHCFFAFCELQQKINKYTKPAGEINRTKWAAFKWQFTEKDANMFRAHLASYKLTVDVALATANLANTTQNIHVAQNLESQIQAMRIQIDGMEQNVEDGLRSSVDGENGSQGTERYFALHRFLETAETAFSGSPPLSPTEPTIWKRAISPPPPPPPPNDFVVAGPTTHHSGGPPRGEDDAAYTQPSKSSVSVVPADRNRGSKTRQVERKSIQTRKSGEALADKATASISLGRTPLYDHPPDDSVLKRKRKHQILGQPDHERFNHESNSFEIVMQPEMQSEIRRLRILTQSGAQHSSTPIIDSSPPVEKSLSEQSGQRGPVLLEPHLSSSSEPGDPVATPISEVPTVPQQSESKHSINTLESFDPDEVDAVRRATKALSKVRPASRKRVLNVFRKARHNMRTISQPAETTIYYSATDHPSSTPPQGWSPSSKVSMSGTPNGSDLCLTSDEGLNETEAGDSVAVAGFKELKTPPQRQHRSSMNNPKLLDNVADSIRRLILPELITPKHEQDVKKQWENRREEETGGPAISGLQDDVTVANPTVPVPVIDTRLEPNNYIKGKREHSLPQSAALSNFYWHAIAKTGPQEACPLGCKNIAWAVAAQRNHNGGNDDAESPSARATRGTRARAGARALRPEDKALIAKLKVISRCNSRSESIAPSTPAKRPSTLPPCLDSSKQLSRADLRNSSPNPQTFSLDPVPTNSKKETWAGFSGVRASYPQGHLPFSFSDSETEPLEYPGSGDPQICPRSDAEQVYSESFEWPWAGAERYHQEIADDWKSTLSQLPVLDDIAQDMRRGVDSPSGVIPETVVPSEEIRIPSYWPPEDGSFDSIPVIQMATQKDEASLSSTKLEITPKPEYPEKAKYNTGRIQRHSVTVVYMPKEPERADFACIGIKDRMLPRPQSELLPDYFGRGEGGERFVKQHSATVEYMP